MVVLMTMLLAFAIFPMIAAEDVATDNLVIAPAPTDEVEIADAGVTPDSAFYGMERAMEGMRLAFTFNKVNKAKLQIKYAEERLSEVQQMSEEENLEAVDEAQELHDELMSDVEETIDEIESNGDANTTEDALEDMTELKLEAETHSEKVAAVKNRILEMKAAGNMSAEQLAHLTEVFNKIIAKAQEMDDKMAQKRENVKTKLKVLGELSDEELEDIDSNITERVNERAKEKIAKESQVEDDDEIESEVEDENESEVEDSAHGKSGK